MDQPLQHPHPLAGFAGGTEWMIDASGCDPRSLRDLSLVQSICQRVITDLMLKVVGDGAFHQFPEPGGVTALYLLTESHLACHTYPEFGFATFNLYCCRQRKAWPWRERLTEKFGADQIVVREIHRELARRPDRAGEPDGAREAAR